MAIRFAGQSNVNSRNECEFTAISGLKARIAALEIENDSLRAQLSSRKTAHAEYMREYRKKTKGIPDGSPQGQ